MKPCPDCQCKNPDTATTCGWCARDVTGVATIPGPEPAIPALPFWTVPRRLYCSWGFLLLNILALIFFSNGYQTPQFFFLSAFMIRGSIPAFPPGFGLKSCLASVTIFALFVAPYFLLDFHRSHWPVFLIGAHTLFTLFIIKVDTDYLKRLSEQTETSKP